MRYATGKTPQHKLHLLQIQYFLYPEDVNCFPSSFEHAYSAITHNAYTTVCTNTSIVSNELEEISTNQEAIPGDNPLMILEGIRKKCVKNIIIGHLNINALANKFDDLKIVLKDKVNILLLVETKLDDSFPIHQFIIEGYTSPYRLDRNCFGGGVLVYVRTDIPSKELKKRNLHKYIEALFVEINLKKTKLLLVGTYHSKHAEHVTSDTQFLRTDWPCSRRLFGLCQISYSG